MNPWIIVGLVGAGIVYGVDYIVRRKKWSQNTTTEKISLILNMVSVSIYAFTSVLGMLWEIVGSGAETSLGQTLYDVTLVMAGLIWAVAIVATLGSMILRKLGKAKASVWINVLALSYIGVAFGVSALAGLF